MSIWDFVDRQALSRDLRIITYGMVFGGAIVWTCLHFFGGH